jgi:hypothetical protein
MALGIERAASYLAMISADLSKIVTGKRAWMDARCSRFFVLIASPSVLASSDVNMGAVAQR